MAMARAKLVDVTVTRWYHCVTRCVRKAFLLGEGDHNRKEWLERGKTRIAVGSPRKPVAAIDRSLRRRRSVLRRGRSRAACSSRALRRLSFALPGQSTDAKDAWADRRLRHRLRHQLRAEHRPLTREQPFRAASGEHNQT